MQIKTISKKLEDAKEFDKLVNAALAQGWKLVKREALRPLAQPNTADTYFVTILYAELELRNAEDE